jgi:LAO/AO transport system kinase
MAIAPETWTPPVLSSVAAKAEGIAAICESLDRHFRYLETSGELRHRRRARAVERVVEVVERRMRQRLWGVPAAMSWLHGRVDDIEAGSVTPYAVADQLLSRFGDLVKGAAG